MILIIVYRELHIEGYYEGILSMKSVRDGFDRAYDIIARIQPEKEMTDDEYQAVKRGKSWIGKLRTWLFPWLF